ncbi:unnamed protein product [Amoebophrya sp. A25]|nr:unnamed protein product [Amoebophrya sp. A25]|eukprot:GSA25T00018392001.1
MSIRIGSETSTSDFGAEVDELQNLSSFMEFDSSPSPPRRCSTDKRRRCALSTTMAESKTEMFKSRQQREGEGGPAMIQRVRGHHSSCSTSNYNLAGRRTTATSLLGTDEDLRGNGLSGNRGGRESATFPDTENPQGERRSTTVSQAWSDVFSRIISKKNVVLDDDAEEEDWVPALPGRGKRKHEMLPGMELSSFVDLEAKNEEHEDQDFLGKNTTAILGSSSRKVVDNRDACVHLGSSSSDEDGGGEHRLPHQVRTRAGGDEDGHAEDVISEKRALKKSSKTRSSFLSRGGTRASLLEMEARGSRGRSSYSAYSGSKNRKEDARTYKQMGLDSIPRWAIDSALHLRRHWRELLFLFLVQISLFLLVYVVASCLLTSASLSSGAKSSTSDGDDLQLFKAAGEDEALQLVKTASTTTSKSVKMQVPSASSSSSSSRITLSSFKIPLPATSASSGSWIMNSGSKNAATNARSILLNTIAQFASAFATLVDGNRDMRDTAPQYSSRSRGAAEEGAALEEMPFLDSLQSGNRVQSGKLHSNAKYTCGVEYQWTAPLRELQICHRCVGNRDHRQRALLDITLKRFEEEESGRSTIVVENWTSATDYDPNYMKKLPSTRNGQLLFVRRDQDHRPDNEVLSDSMPFCFPQSGVADAATAPSV